MTLVLVSEPSSCCVRELAVIICGSLRGDVFGHEPGEERALHEFLLGFKWIRTVCSQCLDDAIGVFIRNGLVKVSLEALLVADYVVELLVHLC